MMQVVAIKKMSAGNECVGEMWTETKVFDGEATIMEVMRWVGLYRDVTLTIPENNHKEFHNPAK